MIDLDASLYVEYDDGTKEPIALIETARDVGQSYKTATVTAKLAQRANLPCFALLYRLSPDKNPADPNWHDIQSFRAMRLWPSPTNKWKTYTAEGWAGLLLRMRAWKGSQLDEEALAA